jgi:acyl-CoA thioester hydrolase
MSSEAFSEVFSLTYPLLWADVDPNGHARHTVYGDYAVDVRLRFLAENGFSMARFQEFHFGPVLLEEHNRYLREVRLGDSLRINIRFAGASADFSRWIIEHEVFRQDGKKAAILRLEGAWLDLETRRMVSPPVELQQAFASAPRTPDFVELPLFRRLGSSGEI